MAVIRQVGLTRPAAGHGYGAANAAIRYAFRAQQDHNLQADPAAGLRSAMFPDMDRWSGALTLAMRSASSE
jgi:hypothetical protein